MSGKPNVDPALVEMAQKSLAVYMAVVHKTDMPQLYGGQALPAKHHEDIMDALSDDSLGHTVVVAPRGAAKTTLVQAWLEWDLGRSSLTKDKGWAEKWRVLYVSNTATQAQRVSNAIRATVQANELYQTIFPKVKPHKEKWGQEEWKVAGNNSKDPNFVCVGVGGPALGFRAHRIVFDDVGDQENMSTPHQREQLVGTEDGRNPGWLDLTAMPVLVPWGRAVLLGTRWAWNDPVAWAQRRTWHELYIRALNEEDESYWPERFPTEQLRGLRAENPAAFARSYQNEVAPEEGLVFERYWFEQRFDYMPGEVRFLVSAWDTASSDSKKSDYSAGIVAAVTPDWHIYIVHLFRARVFYTYLRDAIKDVYRMFGQTNHTILVEKKNVGEALVHDDQFQGYPILPRPAFGEGQSQGRRGQAIEMAAEICRQKRVHLPSEYFCRRAGSPEWLWDLEREVFSWPDSPHDDIVVALTHLVHYVEERRLRWQRTIQEPRQPLPWAQSRERKVRV